MKHDIQVYRCTYADELTHVPPAETALIVTGDEPCVPEGYGLYLVAEERPNLDLPAESTYKMPAGCESGSFVLLADDGGEKRLSLAGSADIPDRTLFTTGQCNSNCIMCPYTQGYRVNAQHESLPLMLRYVELMDPRAEYLCITGGEPTLLRDDFLALMEKVRGHFSNAMVHILTNGRTFAYPDFLTAFQRVRPYKTLLGIPLHADNAQLHDYISQAPGSFQETLRGLDNLYARGEHIELRIVTSKLNRENLPALARMIARRYPYVQHVCMMGLEMMGNAMVNRGEVWCSYDEIWPYVREATELLIRGGVQVELYNYPLCLVDRPLQPLYRRSITPSKVEYLDACAPCKRRDACGGFFRTTKVMPDIAVKPY